MIHTTAVITDSGPVYAKLVCGDGFEFLMKKKVIVIGRNSNHSKVDCHLGSEKNISRKHAIISYNEEGEAYYLTPIGKNGVKVNNVAYFPFDGPVVLLSHSQIRIGDKILYFVISGDPKGFNPRRIGEIPHRATSGNAPGYPPLPFVQPAMSQRGDANDQSQENKYRKENYEKPPFSYATLIGQAITSAPDKKLTLSSIYQWIMNTYPYYRTVDTSWQNSIRHNLSLNKSFIKIPRKENEPGKGSFWAINPQYSDSFVNGKFCRKSRGGGRKRRKKEVPLKKEEETSQEGPKEDLGEPPAKKVKEE